MRIDYPELIIDALAIIIGDYEKYRKEAANMILKIGLTKEEYNLIRNDEEVKHLFDAL